MTGSKTKTCFWLNIFNFLVIFTIVFKKEIPSNYYEWYRFLKNSYYIIGGFEISLYEIENCILGETRICQNKYGEFLQFKMFEMMYLGKLMNVNTFDQPGVELYKVETKKILDSK